MDPKPVVSEEALKKICENYVLVMDDQLIDCKDLKLLQKTLRIDQKHQLRKREAESEVFEGSGDGKVYLSISFTFSYFYAK